MSHLDDATDTLQRFIDEEATPDAVAHLLERARATLSNRVVEDYLGDAHRVSFDDEDVVIEPYKAGRGQALHLPLNDFIAGLQAWLDAHGGIRPGRAQRR